jgi:hypothetical protein
MMMCWVVEGGGGAASVLSSPHRSHFLDSRQLLVISLFVVRKMREEIKFGRGTAAAADLLACWL